MVLKNNELYIYHDETFKTNFDLYLLKPFVFVTIYPERKIESLLPENDDINVYPIELFLGGHIKNFGVNGELSE